MKQMSYVSNPIIFKKKKKIKDFFLTISGGGGFKPRFST